MSELRVNLVKDLFQSSISEHSDAQANFTGLDTKAQNTTAIGGIFLAGALAFFNGDSLQKLITIGSHPAIILLGIVVLLLMLSTAFCIWAMRIQDISISDVAISKEEVEAIIEQPSDELSERYENYLLSQVGEWSRISKGLREVNQRKAKAVRRGQMFLGIAALFAAILLFYTLYAAWNLPPAVKSS
ncbi:MAG: hypothetical protein AABN95_26945 [Acidobacteriota bacterium]